MATEPCESANDPTYSKRPNVESDGLLVGLGSDVLHPAVLPGLGPLPGDLDHPLHRVDEQDGHESVVKTTESLAGYGLATRSSTESYMKDIFNCRGLSRGSQLPLFT